MGVPIEIIIKEYKKSIGNKTFPTLKDYLNSFLEYIETEKEFFRLEVTEKKYVMGLFLNFLGGVKGDYENLCQRKKDEKGVDLADVDLKLIADETVKLTRLFVDNQKKLKDQVFSTYIREKYKSSFIKHIKTQIEFSWLNQTQLLEIAEVACVLFDTVFDRNGYVGFMIAGYGENEIYPSLSHVHLTGFIDGKIRYYVISEVQIDENRPSFVEPLAQVDVMQTFLFGINDQFLSHLASEIPSQISERFSKMNDNLFAAGKKEEVLKQLTGITGSILSHIQDTAVKNYMSPIIESVSTLPIEELGLLAESMINITSIRRKVALDRNVGTVGGPIDVSIISKGDGFIWLKRKHYFDRKYNPQYFYSHYEINKEGDCPDE